MRSHQRLVAFVPAHGVRFTETGSTMWLERLIERWGLLDICGYLDEGSAAR